MGYWFVWIFKYIHDFLFDSVFLMWQNIFLLKIERNFYRLDWLSWVEFIVFYSVTDMRQMKSQKKKKKTKNISNPKIVKTCTSIWIKTNVCHAYITSVTLCFLSVVESEWVLLFLSQNGGKKRRKINKHIKMNWNRDLSEY